MRWLLATLLLSCSPDFEPVNEAHPNPNALSIVVQANDNSVIVNDKLYLNLVEVYGKKLSIKQLQKNVFLIKTPVKEILDYSSLKLREPVLLKKTHNKNMVTLTNKHDLSPGALYGIYFRHGPLSKPVLIYSFVAQSKPPLLIDHDLGDKEPYYVVDDRIIFRFVFDQPIYLHDDKAIDLISLDALVEAPQIDSITVESDQKMVWLRLLPKKPAFNQGARYAFVFNSTVKNVFGQSIVQGPVSFEIAGNSRDFLPIESVSISSSHHSAEVKWSLSQPNYTELMIFKRQNCIIEPCYLLPQSIEQNYLNNKHGINFYLGHLLKSSLYDLFIRSENQQGQILLATGSIATAEAPEYLRFSEIMVNPRGNEDNKSFANEYIEIANISDQDIKIDNVHLSVEDFATGKKSECPLVKNGSLLSIPKRSYFLIVPSGFSKDFYGLDDDVLLIRLDQKTLCGGLTNKRRKTLKLHRKNSHFLDRFGGYLWQTSKGQSIQRLNLEGLDEPNNYCYTSLSVGPTPGKANGACG